MTNNNNNVCVCVCVCVCVQVKDNERCKHNYVDEIPEGNVLGNTGSKEDCAKSTKQQKSLLADLSTL